MNDFLLELKLAQKVKAEKYLNIMVCIVTYRIYFTPKITKNIYNQKYLVNLYKHH